MAQATVGDQPAIITTTNGVQALSFDGTTDDMKTPDVAALRFTGPRGYWAWHLRSTATVQNTTATIVSEWAEGGTVERFLILELALGGILNVRFASSSTSYSDFSFGGMHPPLQAGCWLEVLFDGDQSSTNSGIARCVLCVDGVPIPRRSVSGPMPAALLAGDSLHYWMSSLNGGANKVLDVAHHYVGNDIPTGPERAALRAFEAPQWDTPNLYPSPVFAAPGPITGSVTVASIEWPGLHVANDIGILSVETANQAIATPSGWSAVANASQGVGTPGSATATRLQVFWRRATSSSEPSASLTSTGDHVIGIILTVRGCISIGDPVNASAGDDGGDVDSTAVVIPGATTTVANCLIVAIASRQTDSTAAQQSGQVNASLTGLTERSDIGNLTGNGGAFAIVTGTQSAAGVYGATTATLATASRQGRVSLALRPNS